MIFCALLSALPGAARAAGGAATATQAAPAAALIPLPSGQVVTLFQVIWPRADERRGERRLRYRFVAPRIARDAARRVDARAVEDDMLHLCTHVALPALRQDGRQIDEIVITLMARPVPFGSTDPQVRQFIDTFLPEGDQCQWEGL
ncbi:hypothetical protein GCM10008024_06870 [Allgaiera indica]|uniref:Uncharacterized protein n=1 Tax=Allgaiera indica TaxID=765699 RepID=A0AAN4ZY23_9RHOB|nr:hypothetical protein GCM10008024_06870 [Allgaiera indica]